MVDITGIQLALSLSASIGIGFVLGLAQRAKIPEVQEATKVTLQRSIITDYFLIENDLEDRQPWSIYSLEKIINSYNDAFVFSCNTKEEALALASALNSRESLRLSPSAGETR